ncbi:MAG TPA: CBS domain-containing protein [Planctomycetota bacterium]
MKVREVMVSPVHVCRPQDTLETAARLMWDHDCGMLPVVDREGRVGAAITDRDVCMAALMRGQRLAELRVSEAMSRTVVGCAPDEDVAAAAQRMAERQIHRMPVLDQNGRLCGVVSLNDLVLVGEYDADVGRAAARVLLAACRHRASVPAVVPESSAPAAPHVSDARR